MPLTHKVLQEATTTVLNFELYVGGCVNFVFSSVRLKFRFC